MKIQQNNFNILGKSENATDILQMFINVCTCSVWSGANACKSCRPWNTPQNEYSHILQKSEIDISENEPPKVSLKWGNPYRSCNRHAGSGRCEMIGLADNRSAVNWTPQALTHMKDMDTGEVIGTHSYFQNWVFWWRVAMTKFTLPWRSVRLLVQSVGVCFSVKRCILFTGVWQHAMCFQRFVFFIPYYR